MRFVKVCVSDADYITQFLMRVGDSARTFRYFATRPLSALQNHLCTWVIEQRGEVEAYGHLDQEGDTVWLGIAVTESARGTGLGTKMMERLIRSADELGLISVRLSVDNSNTVAIRLYERFGFRLVIKNDQCSFYERKMPVPAP